MGRYKTSIWGYQPILNRPSLMGKVVGDWISRFQRHFNDDEIRILFEENLFWLFGLKWFIPPEQSDHVCLPGHKSICLSVYLACPYVRLSVRQFVTSISSHSFEARKLNNTCSPLILSRNFISFFEATTNLIKFYWIQLHLILVT